jgi:hypothetical protein
LATFAQLAYKQKGSQTALAFSPDGTMLFSGASDGTIAAWQVCWKGPQSAGGFRAGFF